MTNPVCAAIEAILVPLPTLLPELETRYRDIHAHPELSMQEVRTAGLAERHLRDNGYEVTAGVGKTGVVGVLRNGDGPIVMLRADMDALPIREMTGLDYASAAVGKDASGAAVPVAHSCGHDMHVAWLMGASHLLSSGRDHWKGTLLALFQPGEETAQGARAMIEDRLTERFPKPDVILGQHVMVGPADGSRVARGRSRPRRTAFKSACSAVVHTAPCHKRASIRSSWQRPRYYGYKPLFPVRSPPLKPRCLRWAYCRPEQRRTSFPMRRLSS